MSALREAWAVLGKELRELVRDTHVLTLSVGFPFLFYPLLVWGTSQAMFLADGFNERQPPRVVIVGPSWAQALADEPPIVRTDAPPEALADGDVDAVLVVEEAGDAATATLRYRSTDPRSDRARTLLLERLEEAREARVAALAAHLGTPEAALKPFEIVAVNTAAEGRMATFFLSRALPTMMVAVMLMAALYPAVEVVAGERERGTLETTLVTARSRGAVVVGKVLALVTMTSAAVVGNVAAMGLTVLQLLGSQGKVSPLSLSVEPRVLVEAAPMLLTSCVFVSVVMVVTMLPARTFKAGQNLGSVTMLVGLGLSAIGSLPGSELTMATALIPLASTALVLRDATTGSLQALPAAVAVAELVLLTAGLMWVGWRTVDREGFALGEPPAGASRLLRLLTRR